MTSIEQSRSVDYQVIHFSSRFPVIATPCGKLGPAAERWRYVTCVECLERAPVDPRIEKRLRDVRARIAEGRSAG